MTGVLAALCGLFGSFAVEGLELYNSIRRKGRWPWQINPETEKPSEVGQRAYLVAELIRLLIGAGLAWACAATGQIDGPLGAVSVGAAAPFIIGEITKRIPLEPPGDRPNPVLRVKVQVVGSDGSEASDGSPISASAAEVEILESGESVELCAWIPLPDKSSL
jgi:hypothetical protein